jgi:hypothetical protein
LVTSLDDCRAKQKQEAEQIQLRASHSLAIQSILQVYHLFLPYGTEGFFI